MKLRKKLVSKAKKILVKKRKKRITLEDLYTLEADARISVLAIGKKPNKEIIKKALKKNRNYYKSLTEAEETAEIIGFEKSAAEFKKMKNQSKKQIQELIELLKKVKEYI